MANSLDVRPAPSAVEVIELPELKLQHADAALGFVEDHAGITFTEAEERAVLRKIDLRLMPLMIVSYTIQFMDKSVMAQSAVYDLQTNLGLKGQDYSWCSSIFYFGYMAFQPLAARLLNYFPLGKFVSGTSLAWAILLFCTAGATNFRGMMAVRFFLGMAEGGITPAYVLITGLWYKKDEIPLRLSMWYCGNGVAIILQSLIAYGIGHITTGIPTWKWFFIIFGIAGLFWAVVLVLYMPDTPMEARFLTEREKAIAVERVRDNRTGIANREFKKDQFIEALTDVKVWFGFFYMFVCVLPSTAVANFGSIIIKGFGYTAFHSSLLNMPLGGLEIISLLATGTLALNIRNSRCILISLVLIPAVTGASCVYALPKHNQVGRLLAFYFTNCASGLSPMLFSLVTSNIAGHTKRATANAILFIGYCLGFICGPQFFLGPEAPRYPTGFKMMIATYGLSIVLPLLYYVYLSWQNRVRAKMLQESGEANVFIRNEEFLDLTDKQQVHFVYSK